MDACPLCDAALGRVLLEIDRPDRFERQVEIAEDGYRRRWIECTGCGAAIDVHEPAHLARLRTLSTAYYEVDFKDATIADKFAAVMGLPPERSDNAGRVERVLDFLAGWRGVAVRGRVLDIGAGTGVFLARFQDQARGRGQHWEAVAVEPDPIAARHLRDIDRFTVRQELFTGQPDLAGFDLVTLNKVVEHIEQPVPVLRALAGALAPEAGVAYIEVPDRMTIGRRPSNDNILGALHHHLYDPASLTKLFETVGLVPLQVARVLEPSGKITVYGFGCTPAAFDLRAGMS